MAVELIAEVASNHGGSMDVAHKFIERYAPHVDTIKFQMTRVRHLSPADPQYKWFTKAELSLEQFRELKQHCEELGKQFLVTVYNHEDISEVMELGCTRVKIGSGETNNLELAKVLLTEPWTPLVSCGIWRQSFHLWSRGVFLACESRYPSPRGLAATRLQRGSYYTGWSDHSEGIEECKIAISLGSQIVECHVRLPYQLRPQQLWEKSVAQIEALREYADYDPAAKFEQRWQANMAD